jgi:serine/threonine-protein kinase
MSTDPDDRLLETAMAVADLQPVDWTALRRDLPEAEAVVAGLQAVAEIAAAHGNPGPGPGEAAGDAPVRAAAFEWGRLEAWRPIGAGAFGEVWSAWDRGLQREVALKLRDPASGVSARRWLDEARRLAQVRHPNVVTVHGADEHDGRAGLWMDRVHGRTLEDLLATVGPCSAREAAAIGMDLCAALAAVHGAGLVHGDLKTRNVMREGLPGHADGAGRIVLMDFGSAHAPSASGSASPGTPLYTAPEILQGGRVSPVSDLYALGVLLYRLVTARHPVDAKTLPELREKLGRGEIAPLRGLRPDLPPAFVRVVERALAPDPAQRFPDAATMERALAAGLGVERAPARSRSRGRQAIVPAAAILALAAVAIAVATAPRWTRALFPRPASTDRLSERLAQDWVGRAPAGLLGFLVAGIGDWNADGVPDLAAAAPGADQARGVVHIHRGGASWNAQPDWILAGEEPDDAFGRALSGVGDLNGDGHPDLAVAAVTNDRGGADAGSVYLFWGGPGADAKPDLVLAGRRPGQAFGSTVAPAGDLNGDGAGDLLVGAAWDDQAGRQAGRAYVYFGGPGMDGEPDAELFLGTEGAQFGEGRGIGDFNGDGHDDFAISARNAPAPGPRAGAVHVYFGGRVLDTSPDLVMRGEGDDQFFGALGAGGDVNGDGHPDLVAGAMMADGGEPESGSLYVFFGGPQADARADLVLRGERHFDFFGLWSDASTDFDRDGFADLLVGANGKDAATDSAGAVYFYRGGPHLDDVPELVLRGRGARTGFGVSFAPVGDVSGDGIPDLVVGSPGDRRGVRQGGSVRVFDLARYHVIRPRPRDIWTAGTPGTIEWLGATPADVAVSIDGGRSWRTVRSRAGGGASNLLTLDAPAAGRVRIRIAPADRRLRGGTVEFAVPVTTSGVPAAD